MREAHRKRATDPGRCCKQCLSRSSLVGSVRHAVFHVAGGGVKAFPKPDEPLAG